MRVFAHDACFVVVSLLFRSSLSDSILSYVSNYRDKLNQLLWVASQPLACSFIFLSELDKTPSSSSSIPFLSIIPSNMQTLSPTSVKVNVRLCGSVPRNEMESMSLTQCAPSAPSHGLCQGSYSGCSSLRPSPRTTEGSLRSELCAQLSSMQGLSSLPPRAAAPSYEAPTWAVPAPGEARLEVRSCRCHKLLSVASCILHAFSFLACM